MEAKIDRIAKSESPLQKYGLQMLIIIFIAGGGWVNLSNVSALAQENKEEIEAEADRAQEIEKKLIRIEVKQEALAEDVDDVQETLDKILDAVKKLEE